MCKDKGEGGTEDSLLYTIKWKDTKDKKVVEIFMESDI